MRKVERNMVKAINDRKSMKASSNTEVVVYHDSDHEAQFADVYLFGHHIARWVYPRPFVRTQLLFMPCVASVTTKSRLKALLCELGHWQHAYPVRLSQRRHQWYLTVPVGQMDSDPWIEHPVYADDVWRVMWVAGWDQFKAEAMGTGGILPEHVQQAAA